MTIIARNGETFAQTARYAAEHAVPGVGVGASFTGNEVLCLTDEPRQHN